MSDGVSKGIFRELPGPYYSSSSSFSTTPDFTPPEWEWTWDKSLKSIVLAPIVILTILGNFLVLYAFFTRRKELRSPTHFFIANLSLADFLVGVLAMPFLATLQATERWYFGQAFCSAWVIIHFWLCSASILSTLGVCIERWVGVRWPLRHTTIMNRRTVAGMIVGIWGLAGTLSLSSILIFPEPKRAEEGSFGCVLNNQLGHVLIATIAILYIPATLMIILYWRIYWIATRHLKSLKIGVETTSKGGGDGGGDAGESSREKGEGGQIQKQRRSKTKTWSKINFFKPNKEVDPTELSDYSKGTEIESSGFGSDQNGTTQTEIITSEERSGESQAKQLIPDGESTGVALIGERASKTTRKQINLAQRLALLVGLLLLSYLPFFTAFLLRGFDPHSVPNTVFHILGWIRYFNSAANPIIYAYAVPAYRKAFGSILKCSA